jgi:hypothetical protein
LVPFDFDEVFGEDFLHFNLPRLTEERNRVEAAEITDLLALKAGDRLLDALRTWPNRQPAGSHGHIGDRDRLL